LIVLNVSFPAKAEIRLNPMSPLQIQPYIPNSLNDIMFLDIFQNYINIAALAFYILKSAKWTLFILEDYNEIPHKSLKYGGLQ